jgi:CRP/FNR family transcriptional regulator
MTASDGLRDAPPTQCAVHGAALGEIPACASTVPFLRALPDAALAELARQMRHRDLERGEIVAHVGAPVERLIVVARGRLQAVRASSQGREQVTRVLAPGDFVGELALFTPARHEGDVIAMEPSTVCLLARDAVQALLARHPNVAVRLVEALAQRLAAAEDSIAGLALKDVGARLAAELLHWVPADSAPADEVSIRVPTPWVQIASRLGTTPESLSRQLKAMARQGIITQVRPRTVVIHDLRRLREIAGS